MLMGNVTSVSSEYYVSPLEDYWEQYKKTFSI